MVAGGTLSRRIEQRSADGAHLEPHLFVLFGCTPEHMPPARCLLSGISQVSIGRSEEKTFAVTAEGLRIGLPDPWLSSRHLLIRRVLDSWAIEDAGSKNGTFLNGRPASAAAPLADGDIIEAGETFFGFRQGIEAAGGAQRVFEADELGMPAPGLATLLPSLEAEFARVQAIARSSVPVVIRGESGTGKEMIAAAVHSLSGRSGAFQAVNCAALPPTLVESELFGYRKGAFSGADEDRTGLVRAADGGTLFLDEIGDLPLGAQGALLRVLQESEVLPVGMTRPVKVDVRVLAATHRDLDALVTEQRFRGDLLARIRGLSVRLPPLRERCEDLGLLIRALLRRKAQRRAGTIAFTVEAARALLSYGWPLNVRELEKCLDTALVLAGQGPIALKHLPEEVRKPPQGAGSPRESGPPPDALPEADRRRREEILDALRAHGGNVTAAAKALGKHRAQVQRWIRRYRIDRAAIRR
jgi:DNA-binding NtrC family response regulator